MAKSDAMMRARRKRSGKIQLDPSKKGSLHTALGIPQGQPVPISTINSKLPGASGNLKKKLVFAKNAKTKFGK